MRYGFQHAGPLQSCRIGVTRGRSRNIPFGHASQGQQALQVRQAELDRVARGPDGHAGKEVFIVGV